MSNFDSFIARSIEKTAGIIGEPFLILGSTVNGIMEELEMDVARAIYGDTEEATAEVAFPSDDLPNKIYTGIKIKRISDGARFKILSFDSSTKHYTFKVKRMGKESRGE